MKMVNKLIEVVAWSDDKAIPYPIRFRITEDCIERVVKLNKSMLR